MGKKIGNRGFSLVELLVSIALLAIVMAAAANLLSSGLKASQFNMSIGHILAPGRNAMNIITEQLRYNAVKVTQPAAGANGVVFTCNDDATPLTTYSIYRDSGTRAIFIEINGVVTDNNKLAKGMVESLNFTRAGSSVDVTIELNDQAYKNPDGSIGSPTRTLTATVVLSNLKP